MNKIPTVIVHGSLGSGKTTLVVSLLHDPFFANSLVIENEFANENIDKVTVADHQHTSQVYDIAGGCICCSSGKELSLALADIARREWKYPVIIETTGVAQSAQLIKQLFLDAEFLRSYQLIKNIYVVDPLEVSPASLATEHFFDVALSDVVVIGKVDLVHATQDLELFEREIKKINPAAVVVRVRQGQHTLEAFAFTAGSQVENNLVQHIAQIPVLSQEQHGMQYAIERIPQPVSKKQLDALEVYVRAFPEHGIKRVKGYVEDTDGNWWHLEATAHHWQLVPSTPRAESLIVVIAAHIPEHFITNAFQRTI